MDVIFSQSAARDWKKLPKQIQLRLQQKLDFYSAQANPQHFAKHMQGDEFGEYRFRVGDYRIIVDIDSIYI